jgi:hypothetical protein
MGFSTKTSTLRFRNNSQPHNAGAWNGDTDALHSPRSSIIRKRYAQLTRDRLARSFVDIHHRYQSCFAESAYFSAWNFPSSPRPQHAAILTDQALAGPSSIA